MRPASEHYAKFNPGGRRTSDGISGMRLVDLPVPSSPVACLAREVATEFQSTAMLNHCERSYLWAAAYGLSRGIEFDAELLFVASQLHDLGLAAPFDAHAVDFEHAGAAVAWVFGAGAGWPVTRRRRTGEIIVAHMADAVDVSSDPEGFLLELATALDISGRRADDWPAELRAEVLADYPRLDLAAEFGRCFADQARRKPSSTAAGAVSSGINERLRANPLER